MAINKMIYSSLLLLCSTLVQANTVITIYSVNNNQNIGTVTAMDSKDGLVLIPHLHDLPPGKHGFHVHEHPSCADHAECAGGHLDPQHTGKHLGPYNLNGHLGDLPVLEVAADGTATKKVMAPRLRVKDIVGHSLMIHEGGDNYSDLPVKLGGGGKRIACGSIGKG